MTCTFCISRIIHDVVHFIDSRLKRTFSFASSLNASIARDTVERVGCGVFDDLPELVRQFICFLFSFSFVFDDGFCKALFENILISEYLFLTLLSDVLDSGVTFRHGNTSIMQRLHLLFLIEHVAVRHFLCLNQVIERLNSIRKWNSGFKCLVKRLKTRPDCSDKR